MAGTTGGLATHCTSCGAPTTADANFCTGCGANLLVPVEVSDDAPTQVFDLPDSDVVQVLDVDLVTCPACGAPNAAARRSCGRCDAALDTDHEPDLFDDEVTVPAAATRQPPPDDDEPTVPPHPRQPAPAEDDRQDQDPTLPPAGADATLLTPLVEPTVPRADDGRPPPRDPTAQLPVIERQQRPRTEAPAPGVPSAPPVRRRWPAVLLVAVAVTAGSALGIAIATDRGPFADTAAVTFDAARYPSDPDTLALADAEATSARDDASAVAAVDGDFGTAWIAAADDQTPTLTVRTVEPVWLRNVVVATGQPVAAGDDAGRGRVVEAFLELNGERAASVVLNDQQGEQLIRLLTPVLTDRVSLVVAEVADGTSAAVTELRLVGHVADGRDAATMGG